MPVRLDIHDDPSVIGISQRLCMEEDDVVGRLVRIWSWFSRHTVDGMSPVCRQWIDKLVNKEGFAKAMEEVGWLIIGADSMTMPHFDNWLSESAKRRLQKTKAKQEERDAKSVARLSSSLDDKKATTGQDRTGELPEGSSLPDRAPGGRLGGDSGPAGSRNAKTRKAKTRPSVFASLTDTILGDEKGMRAWFAWQLTQDPKGGAPPVLKQNEWDLCWEVARYCFQEASHPVGLFCHMIGKRDFERMRGVND